MTDEPAIVKELRESEKLGVLHGHSQSNYGEPQMSENPVDETLHDTSSMVEDDLKNTRKNIEIVCIEEKYRKIFENYTVAITLVDEKERIVSWNKYTEELLNMSEKDLYLRSVSSLYPLEEWKKIRAENVRQKGIKYQMETKMIKKNKVPFDVELSLCILKGDGGKIAGSVGIIKDVTQMKKSEKNLKESEERYRTIFENSAVGIMLTDENERIISWNKHAGDILGMSKEDMFLKPVELLYPTDEWKKIRLKNIRQKGMQHHLETKMFKKDNEIINIDLSVSVLKNHEGNVIGSIGVIEDITENKKMREDLSKSEERFKQLYEKAPVPYHTLSPDGVITDVNERWCQTFGYEKRNVLGKSIFNFVDENERESAKSSFEGKIQSKKSYNGGHERKYVIKDGRKIILIIHDFFSFDNDNNIISVHTTMEDITERKQSEKDLKEASTLLHMANQELERKVEERNFKVKNLLKQKDDFINQLGHDLKNPLTPVLGFLPMILKKEKDPELRELLEATIGSVNFIRELVYKTLQLARLNSSIIEFNIVDIHLLAEVNAVVKNNQHFLKENNIEVENKVNEKIFVKADKIHLKELIGNLISNAIKYTNDDEGKIIVDAVEEDGNFVTISVKDTGVGMIQEQIDHVFDEFYKVDESRQDFDSSGLGLSICKRIVEKHGGRIWAESPGTRKGSTFHFTLKSIDKKE